MKQPEQRQPNRAPDWSAQTGEIFSRPLIIGLLLAFAALLTYWPVRTFDFLGYDDPLYFTQNSHVLSGLTWGNVAWAFTAGDAANWHPLTWLSLMLDAECFGNQPSGPHLVNLLWHVANTILVFVLFNRLTASVWRSALVAGLFALHPMHVESVAWVAERKDLLCAFFVLLTLLAYAKTVVRDECCVTKIKSAPSRITHHASRYYFLSLLFFACALMSKPMAVTLPFLLLLLDWWPLQRFNASTLQRLVVEKIPFFVLAAVASVITFIVQKKSEAVVTLGMFSLSMRIENALVSYARYLAKLIWPATLATPYPHPGHWPAAMVAVSAAVVAGWCVAAIWSARKFPFVFTGWFWFAGMLVPVIGLVQVGTQAMADRYMYLPSIGLFIILTWGAAHVAARWNFSKTALAAVAVVLLAASAVRTRGQLNYWQNDFTLCTHALTVTTDNCAACVNLGTWLLKNGRSQEALPQYQEALRMRPTDPLVLYDAGNALADLGHVDEAIDAYHRALQFAPRRPNILNNLGCALLAQNRLPEAIASFEAALEVKPDFAYAHNSLANAFFRQNRFADAAEHFQAAVQFAPDNSQFRENLGDALMRLGKAVAAAECYRQALQLNPGSSEIADKLNASKR